MAKALGTTKVATITIPVRDADEAVRWYTEKLDFKKRQDRAAGPYRWLTISPKGQREVEFLLAGWYPELVGKSATWVVHTENCPGTFEMLRARGVEFVQEPEIRPYGTEAVFVDLYGNRYSLLEPSNRP